MKVSDSYAINHYTVSASHEYDTARSGLLNLNCWEKEKGTARYNRHIRDIIQSQNFAAFDSEQARKLRGIGEDIDYQSIVWEHLDALSKIRLINEHLKVEKENGVSFEDRRKTAARADEHIERLLATDELLGSAN